MRPVILIAALSAAVVSAGAAYAAGIGPVSQISVAFDQKLLDKQEHVIGAREQARLEKQLRTSVERELGGLDRNGGRLELVIEDAKPNRPTWTEMSYKTGLSYAHSFGIGGAKIKGVYVAPDGSRTPVSYQWYDSDIRNSRFVSEWHDVDRTFDRFARRLGEG